MELIPLDDEEPILIEEKTKQEEKGVSLTKTNRRESGEVQTFEETRLDTRK